MIRRHDFNSEWWGADVGVATDVALFDLDADQRDALLAPWAWVEVRAPLDPLVCARAAAAGFALVDTQIPFRIGLARIETSPSVDRLDVAFANDAPFTIAPGASAAFEHERFAALPGVTSARLAERYDRWAAGLVADHPSRCMRVLSDGDVQGWFLGRDTDRGLELTLAMLAKDARISGQLLYHRALRAFGEGGARMGYASFSVTNTAVLNIYAALGARFIASQGAWLWRG